MRQILTVLVLLLAVASGLYAAVTGSGKNAYEFGRAAILMMAYNDEHTTYNRTFYGNVENTEIGGTDELLEYIGYLKPEWEVPLYESYFETLEKNGIDTAVLKRESSPSRVSSGGDFEFAQLDRDTIMWFNCRAENYSITYKEKGELFDYSLDGELYFFFYLLGDEYSVIEIRSNDLTINGEDFDDTELIVKTNLETAEFQLTYNGKKLSGDDLSAFTPIVMAGDSLLR